MSTHTEPLLDQEDSDYAGMGDCVSSDGFTPSLPTLINRPPDTDAQSVSDVESISNGETISDTADDYDEISYSEIPTLASVTDGQDGPDECSEEDLEHIMMSDRTIVPDTPTLAQRMPQLSTEVETRVVHLSDHARFKGFYQSDEPFVQPKDRPLRLMFVGDAGTSATTMALIISKIVTCITREPSDKEKVLDAAAQSDQEDAAFCLPDSLSTPIDVSHIVGLDLNTGRLRLKGGGESVIKDLAPDFAVLYHTEPGRIPHLVSLALKLSYNHVPMLEITNNEGNCGCIVQCTLQGRHCLRMSHGSDNDNDGEKSAAPSDRPLLLRTFVSTLDDEALSRHLAYISSNTQAYSLQANEDGCCQEKTKASKPWSFQHLQHSSMLKILLHTILALAMIFTATGVFGYLFQPSDPLSELSTRAHMLQTALNKSSIMAINATDVLRYPATTTVQGLSTLTGVTFPTVANVYVAKPDQLLVSLPKPYGKADIGIAVLKNGKALSNANVTRLIDGVYSVSLPSPDAHGQVLVSVLRYTKARRNDTIKVDLGNRLLQRLMYENAAKGVQQVQQEVSEAHNAAKLVRAKILSDVQSALDQSVGGIKSLGGSVLDTFKSTGNAIGTTSNQTAQGIRYMGQLTYNTSSAVGCFVKGAVPQKRHFVRARNNALKIRTRLLGKSMLAASQHKTPVGRLNAIPRAFSSIKTKIMRVPGYLRLGADAQQESVHPKPVSKNSNKAILAPTKAKSAVKSNAVIVKKSKKVAGLEGEKHKQCTDSSSNVSRDGKCSGREEKN